MKYRKFIIRNYRAVDSAEVPVGNKLIPLIGVNESGKTSILKAILSFDKNSDKYGGGNHLQYKNNYIVGDHDCSVSAEVVIDSEEDLNAISEKLDLTRGDELMCELEELKKKRLPLTISRELNQIRKTYRLSGLESSPNKHNKLAKAIYELLPLILYFDDFADRVPEIIDFDEVETGEGYKLRRPRLEEWRLILEEIFARATNNEHDLKSFLKIDDADDQDGLLNDINDVLDKEVMDDWRRLKKTRGSLADDTKKLNLELRFQRYDDNTFEFQFKVTDRSRDKKRVFNVVARSKGFQWFFNFLMKLKFNPKYQEDKSGAIYLLDEPGSYLHSSAQDELLKELEGISHTNTILYCTHSQHLLDPEVINIGQTRIVAKEDGRINVIPFGSAKTNNFQGALSPLLEALQMRAGIFNKVVKKAIITEGIIDYYWFTMLSRFVEKWALDEIDIIPGAGAGNLKELISWSIAWADSYMVLLDSDKAGKEAYRRYADFFGEGERQNLVLYETPNMSTDVQLEDFISTKDKDRILSITKTKKLKSAIIELFFLDETLKSSYFEGIEVDTINNMSLVHKAIKAL